MAPDAAPWDLLGRRAAAAGPVGSASYRPGHARRPTLRRRALGASVDLPPGGHPEPPERLTDFQRAVVEVVARLQPGDVVTYAEVALEAGRPGSAQAVANVLRRVPGLPWWRVVPSTGRVYRTHAPTQVPLLRRDGVEVDDHRRILPR